MSVPSKHHDETMLPPHRRTILKLFGAAGIALTMNRSPVHAAAPAVMRRAIGTLPELRRILVRQLGIRTVQFAQNAACNRLHNVRQRLARWLLVTLDRIDSELITTTHDFLSKMIGTDRPTVSVAVGDLERDGIILRSRGSIFIVNRTLLEQQSCRCYAIFKQFNAELGLLR